MTWGVESWVGAKLTERERGVLDRILQGGTNKEIAEALGCSVKTVEFHVTNILKKTGAESRLQLAAEALRRAREQAEGEEGDLAMQKQPNICGTGDKQDVELYDGTLGSGIAFVNERQTPPSETSSGA